MFPAAIMMPNWVPPALATSWTRLLFVSAMYTSPAPLTVTPAGPFSSADVAGPPSPVWPLVPVALPAKVEMIPDEATTFWTRLLPVSAMYRSPAPLSATPPGAFSSAAVAAPPSPDSPLTPAALPATVEIVPEAAATFWTRLLPVSAIYRSPPVLSVIPAGDSAAPRSPRRRPPKTPNCPTRCPQRWKSSPTPWRSPGSGCCQCQRCTSSPPRPPPHPAERPAAPAPPPPLFPATPVADPAIVYTSPAIIAIPHWVPLLPATSCTRCPSVSAIYRFPPADSTPCGEPKGADAAGPPLPLLVPSPSRVYRSPGTGLPVASDDAQLSVHPYPSGPGVPACVCCPARFDSYVRVKPRAGPNPGTDTSMADWVKTPFSVFAGS